MSVFYSSTETAAIVRKELKSKFPGTRFSVVRRAYAGGASIDVKWLDGPIESDVKELCLQFQGSTFDGMTDSRTYHSHMYNGQEARFGADYVSPDRQYTEAFLKFTVKMFRWAFNVTTDEIELRKNYKLFGVETFYASCTGYKYDRMDIELSKFIAAMPGFTGKNIDYDNQEYIYKKTYRERAKQQKEDYARNKADREERDRQEARERDEYMKEAHEQGEARRDKEAREAPDTEDEALSNRMWQEDKNAQTTFFHNSMQEEIDAWKRAQEEKRANFRAEKERERIEWEKAQENKEYDFIIMMNKERDTMKRDTEENTRKFEESMKKSREEWDIVRLRVKRARLQAEREARWNQRSAAQENLRKAREQAEKLRQQEEKERQEKIDAERKAREELRREKARQDDIDRERVKEEIKKRDAEERGKRMVLRDKFAAREYLGLGMFPSNADIIRAFRDLMKKHSDGRGGYVAGVDIDFLVKVKEMALEPITVKK